MSKRPDTWTKEEEQLLIDNHNKYAVRDLPPIVGRSFAAIKHRIKKLKLRRKNNFVFKNGRVCFVDVDFFKNPNILNSYWAGYIAADGNITNNRLTLCCTEKDVELLNNFMLDTKCNYNLKYNPPSKKKVVDRICSINGFYKLSLSANIPYAEHLFKYWNITPNKSLTLQPPNITDQLQKYAYICGLFDGDGYITFTKNTKRRRPGFIMGFSSASIIILNWIREQLQILCPNLSWNDKIYGKGNNLHIKFGRKKARIIHQKLKELIQIPMLKRKWDIIYRPNE